MKKLSLGDLCCILILAVIGVGEIGFPFYGLHLVAQRKDPIDSVGDVIGIAVGFVLAIPILAAGVRTIWSVVSIIAEALLASLWWGHLKEGMRKEDVLHILGEPTFKGEGLSPGETWWSYRYRWFGLRGYVTFGSNNTVISIDLRTVEPEMRFLRLDD